MKKIDKYDNDTAAELLAHPNEYTVDEFVYSRSLLNLGWDMQKWADKPEDERIMTPSEKAALDDAAQERVAVAVGEHTKKTLGSYERGYNAYKAIFNSSENATPQDDEAIRQIVNVITPLNVIESNFKKFTSTLQSLRDRVQAVAVNSASNAWRLAYIAQTVLLNELLKEQGGKPNDEGMTLDGLERESLEGIVDTIPQLEVGMFVAGSFNNLLVLLAGRFKMKAFRDASSEFIANDASFPVMAKTSKQLTKVIRTKLSDKYVGVERGSTQDQLQADLETFLPLLTLSTIPERPKMWQHDAEKAEAIINGATMANISQGVNDAYNLMLDAMSHFSYKSGGAADAEKG